MEQIRPLTSLSHDELVARIEQYEEVVQLRDAEICNLNEGLDKANAGRGALRAAGELESVYEAFGIGAGAREPHILRHNIENVKRRADCLNAIEREFFMVRGEPDEDYPGCEPDDECLLRWGDDPSSYIERFRAALDRIRPVESADRKRRGEPVAWPEAVEVAKADALTVFAESCNHTKDAIEYMAAALIHTHAPQPAEPVKAPSETEYVDPLVRALGWEDHGGTPPAELTAPVERI